MENCNYVEGYTENNYVENNYVEGYTGSNYVTLCLSGGGNKGLAQLGALHYVHFKEMLNHIRTYVGTSIGSVINLLLCIGYTPMEIYLEVMELDSIIQGGFSPYNLKTGWGVISIEAFTKNVERFILKKFDNVPTLQELYEITGKRFVVVTCNLTTMKMEYTDYLNFPNRSCIDAIKTSCNIFGVFSHLEIDDNEYIDGGFGDNYPLKYADSISTGRVLGICTDGFHSLYSIDLPFFRYVAKALTFSLIELHRVRREDMGIKNRYTTIDIVVKKSTGVISLQLDRDDAKEKFMRGYTTTKKYFECERYYHDYRRMVKVWSRYERTVREYLEQ